jgi:outer membrane protein OmpA-like peptidoglycan-associated protein
MNNPTPFALLATLAARFDSSAQQVLSPSVHSDHGVASRAGAFIKPRHPWSKQRAGHRFMMATIHLVCVLLLTGFVSHAHASIRHYSATLDTSSWQLSKATVLQCELRHPIPRFGTAIWRAVAHKDANLQFELDMTRLPDAYDLAQVMSVPPQWRAGESAKAIADMALLRQFNGDLPKKTAWTLLTELELGNSPTFYFNDWHSPFDQIAASINPVHFNETYNKFNQCIAALLPFSFTDIALTVLNYESNSDELSRESAQRLQQIALYLKHDKQLARVEIDTYTDSYGGRWINDELSRKRAQTLKQFFIDQGIDAALIDTEGFGEKRHVAPNETPRGRAVNRRAVIQLTKP